MERKNMNINFKNFCKAIDVNESEMIIETLSSFGDDPKTGNRSAGSPTLNQASDYLVQTFKKIGLSSVTKDEFQSCGWTFKGANLKIEKTKQIITLGGYATHFIAKNERIQVVDGGSGTYDDLRCLGDIQNKLVLITIDLTQDLFMTYYAYQAYVRGGKGVLVCTKYQEVHDDILISQDVCEAEYVKMLAISLQDASTLKKLINESEEKEITVVLNSNSEVVPYSVSSNVWGEIKGESDEVIYFISHYDGYYHSYFDDASGVATILGIARALIKSQYQPKKTLRFIAHGAEEWGISNSDFDWGVGAYHQIITLHPEWAINAFTLINIDGSFPIIGERHFQIRTSPELKQSVETILNSFSLSSDYKIDVLAPTLTLAEQFIYERCGILAVQATENFEDSHYYRNYYHSSKDSKSVGLDVQTFELNHQLYGYMALWFDQLTIRPMDFYERLLMFKKSLPTPCEALDEAIQVAHVVKNQIIKLNEQLTDSNYPINQKLYEVFKCLQDNFVTLNWHNQIVFPHENCQNNIKNLEQAIELLCAKQDIPTCVSHLSLVDGNELALYFDKFTYDYFTSRKTFGNQQTFGYGLIKQPNENLYEVIESLNLKFKKGHSQFEDEIKEIEKALANQQAYLIDIIAKEKMNLKQLTIQLLILTEHLNTLL